MRESEIIVSKGTEVYSGPDAIKLYAAKSLIFGLRVYARTGLIPTRGVTISVMLKQAKEYTGKDYKRGDALKAADDVHKWAAEMQAALPTTIEGEEQ